MKKLASYPYIIWSAIFIVIPLILVFLYGITIPSETSIFGLKLSLDNFQRFLEPIYIKVLWRSIWLAIVSTLICVIIGYPFSMLLAKTNVKKRNMLLLLVIIPMWMNFLLRTYAWMTILGKKGLINNLLRDIGLPALNLLYNDGAVILGMVYNFLPFMILPIYTVLTKMDKSVLEAAEDLGANRFVVFLKIVFPLSLPGVISGITMVFMPAVSTFVISKLLGGGQFWLIGNLVEEQFLRINDWHFGSTIALILMVIILLAMGVMSKYDNKEDGGAGLW
ncbi:ABC transporter permease [Clostridium sp. D2Q-11]|uniref:ABC transporter permease n=1 Tax=Anaeromonas frigoriresistens TaxID=2683708 RepID=A0A942ZA99_9FIRM|nr:ABC transporter permease [Anaeromonas frigoriresistens]MBS4540143.1 ABC transporter permease [Anaeromonas frigoriresistens]